ncbi:hypothetical protein CANMA_003886 [Candida margitis]|uniref:uncharacterized protein n=1 Tax=Candida margitis TaxID=1775924 RepID=UPI002227DF0A|nr:uncharacterized protein CANMA_003886 [Candida margitis]KAI5961112.1 hypothetical protein CANMA_003886 [Candida margitis]
MTLIDIITFGTPFGSRYAHEDMSFTSDFNLAANFKRQVAKLAHQLKSNLSPNDCPEEEEENEGKPDSIENVPVLLMLSNLRCDFMKTRYPADDLVLPGLGTLNVTSITPFELMWSSLRLHVMKSCNANATGNFYSPELNGTMQPLEAEECMVQSSLRSAAKSSSHALPILANSTTVGTLDSCKQSSCNKENSVELRFVWHRNVFKMHTYDSNKLLMAASTTTTPTTLVPATITTTATTTAASTPSPATKERKALSLTNSTTVGTSNSCKQSSYYKEYSVELGCILLRNEFKMAVDKFIGEGFKACDIRNHIFDINYRYSEPSRKGPKMIAKVRKNLVAIKTTIAATKVLADNNPTTLDEHNPESVTDPSEIGDKIHTITASINALKTNYRRKLSAFKAEVSQLREWMVMLKKEESKLEAENVDLYDKYVAYHPHRSKLNFDLDKDIVDVLLEVLLTSRGIRDMLIFRTNNSEMLHESALNDLIMTMEVYPRQEEREELKDGGGIAASIEKKLQCLSATKRGWQQKFTLLESRSQMIHSRLKCDASDCQMRLTARQVENETYKQLIILNKRRKQLYAPLNFKSKHVLDEEKKCMISELEDIKQELEKMGADFDADSRRR